MAIGIFRSAMDLFMTEIAWFTPSKLYLERTANYLEKTGTPAGQQYERFGFLGRVAIVPFVLRDGANELFSPHRFYHGYNYDEANSSVSLSSLRILPFFRVEPVDPDSQLI